MNATKPSRRKGGGSKKLEPIDWHEYANDAVLNGNMSTLYHRPATEDPSAYASPEALVEIEKRIGRPVANVVSIDPEPQAVESPEPTVGLEPTVGTELVEIDKPTVGVQPTVAARRSRTTIKPTVGHSPTVGTQPTVGLAPTVGLEINKNVKPIRDVQDALTLAGHILYKAMYGAPDGARSKSCSRGYRQLAAETHLDKDTVRDLISEFKEKGIVRETARYDPDTRSAKTYEVLSFKAILQVWRDAGLQFVTTGRKRPAFCTAQGELLAIRPTVGIEPTVGIRTVQPTVKPTVGPSEEPAAVAEIINVLQQITGNAIDQEAADRLIRNCRAEAPDCTTDEIVEFAWSKAFLCRSGKIDNPIGFLITHVPKHFQGEALQAYRDNKRKQLEAATAAADREQRELAEMEDRQRLRNEIAERHRLEQGIDLKALLHDVEADEVLTEWAKAMLKLGRRYQPRFE